MENDLTIQLRILSSGVEKIQEASGAVSQLNKATTAASAGGMNKFSKTLESAGSRINVLGQRMTWMVTVPLLAFGNKAIETALDVEKAWVSFSKVFSGTEEDFKRLQVAAKELSGKFGRPIEDIINVMTEFNKAGIDGADNLSNLGRVASETAITFDLELADSLEGVKSVMMGYGLSVRDAEQAMADINIIADKTTASEKGVLEVFNRAAGTARQAGFSIQELAASQAAFEKSAVPAGRAGNAMKSILVSLTKQSSIAKDQFAALGVDMTSVGWRTADASEKFEILAKKFLEVKQSGDKLKLADLNEAMASLVGKFQVNNLNVLLEDMANNFDNNADTVSQFYEGLNVAADATENLAWKQQQLDKVMGSSPQKMAQLEQQYRNQMVIIGEKLLPLKVKLMETLIKLLDAFNNLSPGAQDFVIKLGLIAAAAGPVLAFVGLFTSGLGFLLSALSTIGGVLASATGAMATTGAASATAGASVAGLAAAIGPLVLGAAVVATAALIVGAVVQYKQLQTILENCAKAAQENQDKHDALQQKLNTMDTGPLRDQLQKANDQHQVTIDKVNEINKRYSGLPGVFKAVWDQGKTWLDQISNKITGMKTLTDSLGVASQNTGNTITYWQQRVNDMPDGPHKAKMQAAIENMKKMKTEADNANDAMHSWGGIAASAASSVISSIGKIISKLKDMASAAGKAFDAAKKAAGMGLGGGGGGSWNSGGVVYAAQGMLARGRDTIPAMLSPGEMVLTKGQQQKMFNFLSGKFQMQTSGGPVVNINVGTMVASRGEQREFARRIKDLLAEDSNRSSK